MKTWATTQTRQAKVTTYLTNIVGTSNGNPRADLNALFETLVRKYGNYQIRAFVGERDIINSDTDYADYFDDAFGSGFEISHEFEVLLSTMGFVPKLKEIRKQKNGSHSDTTEDTGTITDERDRTVTDTPVNTVTVTPSGVKTVSYTGQNSATNTGTNEGKLGAWDDTNYKGATYDSQSNTGSGSESYTETTTDGKISTTTHTGKATDLVENDDNTRTLNTEKSESGSYSDTETTTLNWTVEELQELISTLSNFDLYNWLSREICYDSCYTEVSFYD